MLSQLKNIVYKDVAIAPLVSFRILFGAATFFSTLRFWVLGWIDEHFVHTQVQFKYLVLSGCSYYLHIGFTSFIY